MFFALQPKSAVLSDSNPELINAYVQVRSNVKKSSMSLHNIRQLTPKHTTTLLARIPRTTFPPGRRGFSI